MNGGLLIGQYVPGNTFIYKINPLNKLVFCIVIMTLILLTKDLNTILILGAGLITLFFIFKLPFKAILKGMKSIIFFLIITFIMHIFFTQEGVILFEYSFLKITSLGLINASTIFIRLFLLILLNSLLTLTTLPVDIAWGFEKILYPAKIFRFPVEEFALMLSLALRFIPVLFNEMNKIMEAQKSRGADFESGNFIKRIMSYPPLLIPLFVNSFYRAEEIAVAMEARCYRGGGKRTHYNKLGFSLNDIFFFFMYLSILILYIIFIKNFQN
jgi:energy-coupling factor transport system permease protein